MIIQYIFRDKKLPELIIFLQKMVRGTLARKRAKKMRAALKVIRNDKVESCVIYFMVYNIPIFDNTSISLLIILLFIDWSLLPALQAANIR